MTAITTVPPQGSLIFLGRGADKTVSRHPDHPDIVFINERAPGALAKEIEAIRNIEKRAREERVELRRLAIELRPTDLPRFYVAPKAERDLESHIARDHSLSDRFTLVEDVILSIDELHRLKMQHGDLKPENFLIYLEEGRPVAKLADWGKSKPLKSGERNMLLGNRRFGPPEGYVSQKGEVYSTALVIIRILEESRPDVASSSYTHRGRDRTARGIEKHRQDHGVTATPANRIRDFVHFALRLSGTEQREIHWYIQNLVLNLYTDIVRQNPHLSTTEISGTLRDLGILLKEMTQDDPSLRPSMSEVKERFAAIKVSLNQLLAPPPSPPDSVAGEDPSLTPVSDVGKGSPLPLSDSSFGSDALSFTPTLRAVESPTVSE